LKWRRSELEQSNVYDVLQERGFIQQATEPLKVREALEAGSVTCYVGFDPTADSLHVGNLMTIMGLMHMQRLGHRPIVVVGGGTAMVGDPSGKTEMRKMLTQEQIQENGKKFKLQLSRYLDFNEGKAIMVDNFDWLGDLNYIDFLREIGRHFSVNRMLSFESYKIRLETGLSFIEFNYQLLQAFDFLMLYRNHDCTMQMGGDDQWGNIVAGIDLVRRLESTSVYGLTFPLLVTATGVKMGKTETGAVWLDPKKTNPYDYYQYWVNVDDRDVERFLAFFTLLPMAEISKVAELEDADLNTAKTILAYEATKITHGEEEARKALTAASGAFGAREISNVILPSSSIPRGTLHGATEGIPTSVLERSRLQQGEWIVALLEEVGLVGSRGEARRLIKQGGIYIDGERISSVDHIIDLARIKDASLLLRVGKKRYHRIICQ